ncbi:MAG: type IV secretion protein IcmC [Gammaproteobacteria bacterium]
MIDITQMLISLGESIDPIERLVRAFAYVIGVSFILKAIYHLKVYGEARAMSATQGGGMKEPLSYLFVGALFVYLPSMLEMMMLTVFGTEGVTPLSYQTNSRTTTQFAYAALRLMQLIGWISFIRGWMILAKSSSQGASSQGIRFGKGISHVVAGLLAINIVGTTNMIGSTLGLGQLL